MIDCLASYNGTVLDAGWLPYITCGEALTPSANKNWPPSGYPNPPLPPNVTAWPKANALSFPAKLDTGYGPIMTKEQLYAVLSMVWVAENSVADLDGVVPWYTAYPYIQNIGDGRGYTTNIVGFCSGTGDLPDMLANLQKIEPCNPLVKYLPDVAALSAAESPHLTGLKGFAELVVQQGGGPNGNGPINPNYIQATWDTLQKDGTDSGYWGTAMAISKKYRLSLPISKGQLYDIALNAGIDAVKGLVANLTVKAPAKWESGGEREVHWLLALQRSWVNYIATTPSIDDGQVDRALMWQHLVDPRNKTLNSKGQVGANNKERNLQLKLPISVNCYGHFINIRAPKA